MTQSLAEVQHALALFNCRLEALTTSEAKASVFLSDRKGTVLVLRGSRNQVICIYSTVQQIINFVERTLTEQ